MSKPKLYGVLTKDVLTDALKRHRGKVAAVADELGVTRAGVYKAIKNHGLSRRKETSAERRARLRQAAVVRWHPEKVA